MDRILSFPSQMTGRVGVIAALLTAFYLFPTSLLNAAQADSSASVHDRKNPDGTPVITGPDIDIYVMQVDEPPRIDGKLDDAAWQKAQPYCDYFFQQEPNDRAPSSEKTKVMVVQDRQNIYFGIQAYDSEPEKLFTSIMRRDGSFLNDESLEILLDTFQDKRNAYAMGTNPLGAMIDAIISDEGRHINKSWDCVWYCKAGINAEGWAAEMAFPFKSFKFKKGEVIDWGLSIGREIKHRKEKTYLVPISRGLGHNGKFKGSLYANLKNIHPPSGGLNLELYPYLNVDRTQFYKPDKINSTLNSGFNARYHVTPQFTVDATYQTDFAQVETDQEIVNVTRFNINLPEKREFFLEGSGYFTFGTGVSSGGTLIGTSQDDQPDFLLFNSRTIGIQESQKIPLWGGVKMAGRTGKYSIGVLNIQGEESTFENGAVEPSTNFTAVKLKRDISLTSNIGLMVLNKQAGNDDYSRAVGVDAFYAFTPEFMINGSVARTFSPEDNDRTWGGDAGFIVNKEWIDVSLRYSHIDSLFEPGMGFVRRENIRNANGLVAFTKWINNDYLRSVSLVNRMQYITDHHGTLESRSNGAEVWLTLKSEDFLSAGVRREYEFLPANDYIRNIRIDRGTYRTWNQNISFNSYRARPFVAKVKYEWGELFDGDYRSISFTNATKVSNHFNLDLVYSHDNLDLLNGMLDANVLSTRLNYSFTTELFVKCFVQWNDVDHRVSTNFLFDYIYKPRSHIYFVYTENRNTLIRKSNNVRDRLLLLKFTYLWSL